MMKRILVTAAALGLLLAPVTIAAQSQVRTTHLIRDLGLLLDGPALNAAAATRTFTVTESNMIGSGVLIAYVDFTHTAATDVQMTCTASPDGGTTYFAIQSCEVTAGDCTSSDANWTIAVSGDDTLVWRVDTLGFPRVQCVFSGTSGGGSDTIDVTVFLASK